MTHRRPLLLALRSPHLSSSDCGCLLHNSAETGSLRQISGARNQLYHYTVGKVAKLQRARYPSRGKHSSRLWYILRSSQSKRSGLSRATVGECETSRQSSTGISKIGPPGPPGGGRRGERGGRHGRGKDGEGNERSCLWIFFLSFFLLLYFSLSLSLSFPVRSICNFLGVGFCIAPVCVTDFLKPVNRSFVYSCQAGNTTGTKVCIRTWVRTE